MAADRWSDPDLVWALFQAALAVPLAVAVLVMLATFAGLGLVAFVGATAPFFWRHRRWTAISLSAVVAGMFCRHAYWVLGLVPYGEMPGDVLAGLAGVLGGAVMQLVLMAARWLWGRRWWRKRSQSRFAPEMWDADALRVLTHRQMLRDALDLYAAPEMGDVLTVPTKSFKYETEDGQRAEIWIDGKPYPIPTVTKHYIVTENGIEPVQSATPAAVGGK